VERGDLQIQRRSFVAVPFSLQVILHAKSIRCLLNVYAGFSAKLKTGTLRAAQNLKKFSNG
jgi:hypothetical protein